MNDIIATGLFNELCELNKHMAAIAQNTQINETISELPRPQSPTETSTRLAPDLPAEFIQEVVVFAESVKRHCDGQVHIYKHDLAPRANEILERCKHFARTIPASTR